MNRLVCIGDSLTCGNASYNYVDSLIDKLQGKDIDIINAGVNGALAWTILNNIQDILECKPTHVSILLESNNIPCALNKMKQKDYWKNGRIPQGYEVSMETYLGVIEKIVDRLQSLDDINIALCSPPVIGEDLQHAANQTIHSHLNDIKALAIKKGIHYLPIHEAMVQVIKNSEPNPNKMLLPKNYSNTPAILAYIKHKFLGKSWNEVAIEHGLQLTVDGIHLNQKCAGIVLFRICKIL